MRFVPVTLILKHRFDSIALAPKVRQPALFMVASEDEMIPAANSQRLFDAWAGPKLWHLVRGEGHNTIGQSADYWKAIELFLAPMLEAHPGATDEKAFWVTAPAIGVSGGQGFAP